jgi:hypothetical protein
MKRKPVAVLPAIRTRTLYRVDYFRNVLAGTAWQGKELFHASSLDAAKTLGRIRAARLGLVSDVHVDLL